MEYLLGNDAIKVELQMGDCNGICGGVCGGCSGLEESYADVKVINN